MSKSTKKGKEISVDIIEWLYAKGYHPDDASDLFVHELLERMEEDK